MQRIWWHVEKDALLRLLSNVRHKFDIAEITTDASSTIIKAIKDLKLSTPSLKDLFHSLDTWHKAKSLRKALSNAAKSKENEDLQQWIESVVSHFWYCSRHCQGDINLLKVPIFLIYIVVSIK